MLDYYARRAESYERIYDKPERQDDLRALTASLPGLFAGRRVLELACGTGWWTARAAAPARRWLATDASERTLAVARRKPLPACVELRVADAYAPALGGETFDAAFAGFWWSHVPLARLRPWLATLHAQLEPGARVVLLDNRFVAGSSTPISRRDGDGNTYQQRTLDDGSSHEVLKNFPTAAQALAALGERACAPRWLELEHYWLLSYDLR